MLKRAEVLGCGRPLFYAVDTAQRLVGLRLSVDFCACRAAHAPRPDSAFHGMADRAGPGACRLGLRRSASRTSCCSSAHTGAHATADAAAPPVAQGPEVQSPDIVDPGDTGLKPAFAHVSLITFDLDDTCGPVMRSSMRQRPNVMRGCRYRRRA